MALDAVCAVDYANGTWAACVVRISSPTKVLAEETFDTVGEMRRWLRVYTLGPVRLYIDAPVYTCCEADESDGGVGNKLHYIRRGVWNPIGCIESMQLGFVRSRETCVTASVEARTRRMLGDTFPEPVQSHGEDARENAARVAKLAAAMLALC